MPENLISGFQFNLYALPVFVVACLTALAGIFIFFQNKKSPVNVTFFLLCAAINFWLLGSTGVYTASNPDTALAIYKGFVFLGVSYISTIVYAFSVFWLNLYEKQKKWVYFGLFGSLCFYLTALLTPYGYLGMKMQYWGYFPKYGISNVIFLPFFFSYFFAAFGNFAFTYAKEPAGLRKKQIGIISVAFLISFSASLDYVSKITDFVVFPIGYISVFTWICMVSYAIVSYKAMDIETVIHKTIMWFASTVITILPFAFLFYGAEKWSAGTSPFFKTAVSLSLFTGFYFYFRAVQPLLSHFFRRKRANLQNVVKEFSGELVHLQNMRDLLKRFVRLIQRNVYSRQISVYLKNEADTLFVPVIAKGVRGLESVDIQHPFLQWLESNDQLAIVGLTEGDPSAVHIKDEIISYMTQMNASVVIPFVLGNRLIGVLHLGKKENLRKYRGAEIDFLSQLKAPMTIAFSNSKQLDDISKLYKQVQSQNERLQELDRLKSEFLANTSHELRTPIHGILGLVESILDGADGEVNDAQSKHLRMIIESGTNLKELINNLLELSRMESGQEVFSLKFFNVCGVIDSVIALTDSLAKKKKIRLARVSPSSVGDVYGDPAKIQRVIMNLVGNAIKFTDKGEVLVRLREDSDRVRVSVEDTGVGIAPEKQKMIFERFQQADGSTTRRFEGTGLGLSIAKEIVVKHGDDITVESEPGKGSVFSFSLSKTAFSIADPASAKLSAPDTSRAIKGIAQEQKEFQGAGFDKQYELAKDKEYQEAIRGEGETVLIIDDNAVNREVIKTRLQLHNYKVVEAVDGVDGLEKVKKAPPALIVLDLMMPRMSGYDFCKELRKDHKADELPVIMLTAKTEMGDKIYGLSLGANDYISKPFNKEELVARIAVLLKLQKMNKELRDLNINLEDKVVERTKELIHTQEQLIQAEKMATIGVLAGGVAHEINNPLTAVLTNAQILKMMPDSYDAEVIDLIEQGAKRCQLIIQKLMKYSRKTAEETMQEKVDLLAVIKTTVAMLTYQFEQENIKVSIEGDAPSTINGIANELEQVFTNLLVNARDAIREAKRKGNIAITVKNKPDAVEVRVKDNGKGIDPNIINKIFDPFFTTKDVGSGTGLGLSVTHNIIQRHNAEIKAVSEPGKETTFILKFPVTVSQYTS